MYDIKYKIEDDITLYSFELKNSKLVFVDYPVFFKLFKNDVDLSYLSKRSYWLSPDKKNNIEEKFVYENEIQRIEEPVFFLFDDYFGNYLHYFLESFPKINYFLKLKEKIPNLKLAMPIYFWNTSFIKESISLYFNNDLNDIILLNTDKVYDFDLMYIPNNIYLWPDKSNFSNIIFDSFKKLSDKVLIDERKEGVYISRQDTVKLGWWHNRHLQNELELIEKIRSKFNYDIIELYHLNIIDKIKIFKIYKTIIQTNGAAMINLLFCNPSTNFHIISHPLYGFWANPILKNASDRLNVNFFEHDFGKIVDDGQPIFGDSNNKPWILENIDSLILKM